MCSYDCWNKMRTLMHIHVIDFHTFVAYSPVYSFICYSEKGERSLGQYGVFIMKPMTKVEYKV